MEISLAEVWAQNPPASASNQTLQEYMAKAPFWSLCYDYYHLYNEFQEVYNALFGKEPFVEASPRFRWEAGARVNEDDYVGCLTRIEVFRAWFTENVMETGEDTSAAVMVLPYGISGPKYRDVPAE